VPLLVDGEGATIKQALRTEMPDVLRETCRVALIRSVHQVAFEDDAETAHRDEGRALRPAQATGAMSVPDGVAVRLRGQGKVVPRDGGRALVRIAELERSRRGAVNPPFVGVTARDGVLSRRFVAVALVVAVDVPSS
jgi:hypothetical protein